MLYAHRWSREYQMRGTRTRAQLDLEARALVDRTTEPAKVIAVDSPEWWSWLDQPSHQSFRVIDADTRYSVSQIVQNGVVYWYGYQKREGKTRKVYLGRSIVLTLGRLRAATHAFAHGSPLAPPTEPGSRLSLSADTEQILQHDLAEIQRTFLQRLRIETQAQQDDGTWVVRAYISPDEEPAQ